MANPFRCFCPRNSIWPIENLKKKIIVVVCVSLSVIYFVLYNSSITDERRFHTSKSLTLTVTSTETLAETLKEISTETLKEISTETLKEISTGTLKEISKGTPSKGTPTETSTVTSTVTSTETTTESPEDSGYLIRTEGCTIQELDPFDKSIIGHYQKLTSRFGDCHHESYIEVDDNKLHLNLRLIDKDFANDSLHCKYKAIGRDDKAQYPDYCTILSDPKELSFGVPIEDEYLFIECFGDANQTLFQDFIALTPLKPEVEERCENRSEENLGQDHLNIIMIAIDSISRLNFQRQFPKTGHYLKNVLKSFDFQGYIKVADNTFINIVPLLAGHLVDEYGGENYFYNNFTDEIPLVFKEFASLGYRTLFIEDSPNFGTFSYLKAGFKYQPTDYFLRPFAMEVEKSNWRAKSGDLCFGHTSETEYFYGYTREVIRKMEDRPFFTFTFISRPTHENINTAGFVDEPTLNLLKDLKDSGVLNRTALFLFSDHGQRLTTIVSTYIGKIEERMPFMTQYYPEWFLSKHPEFAENLKINQKRLTTPFDVHKTLQDIVTLSSKNGVETFKKENVGFGASLFEEMPTNRTCDDAHVPAHWCTCNNKMKVWTRDTYVKFLGTWMINTVNEWTKSNANDSKCVLLTLKNITEAYVSYAGGKKTTSNANELSSLDYLIVVQASPSDALFEGTVRYQSDGKVKTMGDFSRINMYGNQSWCIDNHRLKKFCYCREQL